MTTIAIVAIVALLLNSCASLYFANRDRSRWFIERQQLQSKLDTLVEKQLQHNGLAVDFTKPARRHYTDQVRKVAFAAGWKSDAIATPPTPPTASIAPKENK